MGFWDDLSPQVKAVLGIGLALILYLGLAKVTGIFPFGKVTDAQLQQQRGLPPH
jgi:hypothetical protein